MDNIKAIGFDLFNTLITLKPDALKDALKKLITRLQKVGFHIDPPSFQDSLREATARLVQESRQKGRETHNRFWISAALESQGYMVLPDDTRISESVDAYFSVFVKHSRLIPGTKEMLETVKKDYSLGLLSNFTHSTAAVTLLDHLGLTPFFEVVLISGDLGYCKPHPIVFHRLIENLGFEKEQILYVGDDPEADINGASRAGLQPIWTTYVQDHNIPIIRGALSVNAESPEHKAPRISTWREFLALLNKR